MSGDVRFLRYIEGDQERFVAIDLITAAEYDGSGERRLVITTGDPLGECKDIIITGPDAKRGLRELRQCSSYDVVARLMDADKQRSDDDEDGSLFAGIDLQNGQSNDG
jgi:hypothetical protein